MNPFRPSSVHPMALQCFLSTLRKESIQVAFKFAFIFIGYVDFGPRNSYLSDEGRGFNSTSAVFGSSYKGLLSSYNNSTLVREGRIAAKAFNN